jgi:hypothetical protein
MKSVAKTFVSIATNNYLGHWENQVESLIETETFEPGDQLIIFTNEVSRAETFFDRIAPINHLVIKIPNYKWPEATLFRYKIMTQLSEHETNQVIVYLDADMLLHRKISKHVNFEELLRLDQMLLVSHPGFWRGTGFSKLRIYLNNPILALRDLYLVVRTGGIGSWETNQNSRAFVPYKLRKNYFCGGIWLGTRVKFMHLVEQLSQDVEEDYKIGRIARWHDESHLNAWATKNPHLENDPSLCFDPIYKNLIGLTMVVEAVRK